MKQRIALTKLRATAASSRGFLLLVVIGILAVLLTVCIGFLSYTRGGFREDETFVDQYLAGEAYVFSIERDGEAFTMSVSGRFARGGATSYRATRPMRGPPPIWHYNRAAEEYPAPVFDQVKTYLGKAHHTWPSGSAYPEHFFFGDPHINFYEGSAEFDDLKLYVPE